MVFSDTSKFSGTLPTRYVVRYRGAGALEYNELARLIERADHRDLIEIASGTDNATITLSATDPDDPLRDITMLRFMTLGHSCQFAQSRWDNRPLPTDARWNLKGAPLEVMISLANKTGKDPWFTIPHAADDDYARRFAQTVKKSLDPKLKVYLEYSNEVWNPDYPQFAFAAQKGRMLDLGDDPRSAGARYQSEAFG